MTPAQGEDTHCNWQIHVRLNNAFEIYIYLYDPLVRNESQRIGNKPTNKEFSS